MRYLKLRIHKFMRISIYMVSFLFCIYLINDIRHPQISKLPTASIDHATKIILQNNNMQNVFELHSVGNFTSRLAEFNDFLSHMRSKELKRYGSGVWQRPISSRLNVVLETTTDYIQQLSNYSNVKTVLLPWLTSSSLTPPVWRSNHDYSNLLIQTYHTWTVEEKLCTYFERTEELKMQHGLPYKCYDNPVDTEQRLQPRLSAGQHDYDYCFPGHFYINVSSFVFVIHIHRDAIVTGLGDVFSGNYKLVLRTCRRDMFPFVPFNELENVPLYNELFVINQYWGYGYFHFMVEVVPRIALCIDFLKMNPQIHILVPRVRGNMADVFTVIGLKNSRLVTGNARAKIAYHPKSTACGIANLQEIQFLSELYRNYTERTLFPQPRNKLILIRRSGTRRFTEQQKIEEVVKNAAENYSLTYTLYIDNPPPSLNQTMMMFHSAVMIVGPHGAGLSNMLFSQPGTFIIEGLCYLPVVNVCYQRLAVVLGHRWHGIISRSGCPRVVDVSAESVGQAVRNSLCEKLLEQ